MQSKVDFEKFTKEKEIILNLNRSRHQTIGTYEMFLDFRQRTVGIDVEGENGSKERAYALKGLRWDKAIMYRSDERNIIKFNLKYNPEFEEEVNQTIEKGLLAKLHPDTRMSITINWNRD